MFQGSGGFGGGGGGGGGFGGGGFNTSSQGPSFTSPGRRGGDGAGANKPTSLMPVTVHMMMKAEHNVADDFFNYNGTDIHMVQFVGIIRDITEASTSITYNIDDYTGPTISVRKFIQEGEEDTSNLPRSHTYVHVAGNLRSLNGQRSVIAFVVRPVKSHNEITRHMLAVVRAQLRLKNPPVGDGGMAGANASTAGTGTNGAGNDNMSGLNPAQTAVYNALKASTSDIGMSIIEITKIVNHLTVTQIRSAIDFLSNEGHIYSTVDDEHYKLTDYC